LTFDLRYSTSSTDPGPKMWDAFTCATANLLIHLLSQLQCLRSCPLTQGYRKEPPFLFGTGNQTQSTCVASSGTIRSAIRPPGLKLKLKAYLSSLWLCLTTLHMSCEGVPESCDMGNTHSKNSSSLLMVLKDRIRHEVLFFWNELACAIEEGTTSIGRINARTLSANHATTEAADRGAAHTNQKKGQFHVFQPSTTHDKRVRRKRRIY
jgi:hypothetical protein